jgi:hypothetical protein
MNEAIDELDRSDEDPDNCDLSDEALEAAGRIARSSFFYTILGGSGCC